MVTIDVVGPLTATALAATGMIIGTAAPVATTTRTDGTDPPRPRGVDLPWTTTRLRADGTRIHTGVTTMALPRSRMLMAGLMIDLPGNSLLGMPVMPPAKAATLAMTIDEAVVEVTGN